MLEYEAFQNSFKKTEISGEEVGEMVMKMATHFARYNMKLGDALKEFASVKADYQNQVDPSTGKATSSSRAEILSYAKRMKPVSTSPNGSLPAPLVR